MAILLLLALASAPSDAKDEDRFLSHGRVFAWTGVAVDWDGDASLHFYSPRKYRGHADYVSLGLKTGLSFREFKQRVKSPSTRKYLPFLLYDLRRDKPAPISWALMIEDYEYEDDDASMANAVVRLAKMIEWTRGTKGAVLLARSPRVKPNASIAPALERAGFATMTISRLLESIGARAVEVLNPGRAIGTLRMANESDLLGPHDLAIFEELPRRLPPVAGIITLAPQTPLSHVNLLAKNRGTVNLTARSLDDLPDAKRFIGRLVELDASEKEVIFRPVDEARATRWWAEHRRRRVDIAAPDPGSGRKIVDLDREEATVALVGAKAANYARIRKLLPERVRPGFAIGFAPYEAAIESSGAAPSIAALLADRGKLAPEDLRMRLRAIRERIKGRGRVPAETLSSLHGLLGERWATVKRIRLRSSTNCEDLPEFNGAGLYRSRGFDTGRGDLEARILSVYASLWREQAFLERELFGIDHERARMGILINEAFTDELANAVVITIPGRPPVAWVNAQLGEKSVANPEPNETPESFRFALGARPPGEVMSRASHAVFAGGPYASLLSTLAADVAKLHGALAVKAGPRYGIDLEVKVMEGPRLFIKQARLLAAPLPQ